MLSNFLFVAMRNFARERVYALINLFGLVVGLTCGIFIFLWVADELRFDRFHNGHERIYEVMENQTYSDGQILTYDATPAPLAEKLRTEFAEVEQSCVHSWPQSILFTSGPLSTYQHGYYADAAFFRLFTFQVTEGDRDHLFADNNSVVITRKMADLYFPDESALGKTLLVDKEQEFRISGVVENTPGNSTMKFDFVLPFSLYSKHSNRELSWGDHSTLTFVKLRKHAEAATFESKIKTLLHPLDNENRGINLFLFPLTDWRLFRDFENGAQTGGGRMNYIIMISAAAFFILVAACINFMNLATARAAKRAKEVGIRKVAGATRKNLVYQFLVESMLLSFVSLGFAVLIVHLLMPLFNMLSGKNMAVDYSDSLLIMGLLGITSFVGLLAGSYPAFFLSSFRPAAVLKGNLFSAQKGVSLRKTLVLFQFGLSVVLILCAVVINDQIQYMLNKDLGYDKEGIVHFQPRLGSLKNMESFKSELLQNPLIESVGQGYDHPMNIYNNDIASWRGMNANESITVQTTVCDSDYLKTLGLQLSQGRYFSSDVASDSTGFVINETCAALMGFSNPIGQRLKVYTSEGRVIGVVKDFHNRDFYGSIDPVIFVRGQSDEKPMEVFVRYKKGEVVDAVGHVQQVYKKFEPVFPLELNFLDRDLELMYSRDIMIGQLSLCFMVVIIFIACMGLFGLTLYTTERRTKEIGVRKVLGASSLNVVWMLCKEFARPILLSLMFGFPVAFYLMERFLNQYQFHTELNSWAFLITGASVLTMATATVLYRAAKAAQTNPADTLRMD
jgi:putative ABC transport system permease protein